MLNKSRVEALCCSSGKVGVSGGESGVEEGKKKSR